ncbi:hypothetical protein [Hyphomonas chukchiensis]|uniref:ATP-grasp domain-containing protein n=1 Tax=Hyphomonas chukchiensis TaxID=1280947 RepID=A0A062ULL0_9PROT|nr:hypothetical protein [Hyphomonas chukchiensis]KCZ60759.1 hypothetical protein HY30_00070 [Hyphomonas chukchiensis]
MPRRKQSDSETQPTIARANWFSDLQLTRRGLIVRKTGRRIGLAEITPMEFIKFCLYFAVVLVKGLYVRITRPSHLAVWFAPDRPRPWYILWSAMTLSGVRFARTPDKADVAFYFEDTVKGDPPPAGNLVQLNAMCSDISKSRVADVFTDVSGHPLRLDPQAHQGQAVEKSEANGLHDGRIVDCPIRPAPGKTYQRLIDSSDGTTAFDYRTTIIGRVPRFVLVKTKQARNRFSMHNDTVVYRELAEVFMPAEIDVITRFAAAMALDWAALDVLRDAVSGQIYVVDVNKTDTGPAVDLSWRDRSRVMRAISQHFLMMITGAAQLSVTGTASQAARTAPEPIRSGYKIETPRQV